jgi:hypothetical protein
MARPGLKDTLLSLKLPRAAAGPRVTEMDGSGAPPERLFPSLRPRRHEALLLSGGTIP